MNIIPDKQTIQKLSKRCMYTTIGLFLAIKAPRGYIFYTDKKSHRLEKITYTTDSDLHYLLKPYI